MDESIYRKRLYRLELRCLRSLRRARSKALRCPRCGAKQFSNFVRSGSRLPRLVFQCRQLDWAFIRSKKRRQRCRKQFGPRTGTMFEKSHIPLYHWFAAIALLTLDHQWSTWSLARELHVSYKTAWVMKIKLRRERNKAFVSRLQRTAFYIGRDYRRLLKLRYDTYMSVL